MPTKAVNSVSSVEEERWQIPNHRTGCAIHPSCLECPVSICAEEFSEGTSSRSDEVSPSTMWAAVAHDLNNGKPVPGARRLLVQGGLFKLNATGRRLLGIPIRHRGEEGIEYASRLIDYGASIAEACHIAGANVSRVTQWRKKHRA